MALSGEEGSVLELQTTTPHGLRLLEELDMALSGEEGSVLQLDHVLRPRLSSPSHPKLPPPL